MPLFSGVGSGPSTANFTNTIFDDNAATPIQNGAAPFFATFNPQMPLAALRGPEREGDLDAGHRECDDGQRGHRYASRLVAQLPETVADLGLGEPGSDNISASFRIFTLGQTDRCRAKRGRRSGPAAIDAARTRAASADWRSIPSDPSGNTVYVAGASGGIWKTTDFLTTNPDGPTYIPLTDLRPDLRHQHQQHRGLRSQ